MKMYSGIETWIQIPPAFIEPIGRSPLYQKCRSGP